MEITAMDLPAIDEALERAHALKDHLSAKASGAQKYLLQVLRATQPLPHPLLAAFIQYEDIRKEALEVKGAIRELVRVRQAVTPFDPRKDYLHRLNAQVADAVMGHTVLQHDMPLADGKVVQATSIVDDAGARKPVPNYAGEPGGAHQVIETVRVTDDESADSWEIWQDVDEDGVYWSARFDTQYEGHGDTWMEAVCRCALEVFACPPVQRVKWGIR